MFKKFLIDSSGQDVVEYALLVALVVVGLIVVFPEIFTAMTGAWSDWGTAVYNDWEPPAPGGV